MSDQRDAAFQRGLRKRIARLELQQAERVEAAKLKKKQLDLLIADKQRELDNLRAQVTIGVAK